MKYQPPRMEQLTPDQRKLYLKIQAEEDAEEERYASDPVLLKRAEDYHRELELMVKERAQPRRSLTLDQLRNAVNQSIVSGDFSNGAGVGRSGILSSDSFVQGSTKPVDIHTTNKRTSVAVRVALVANKGKKKFQEG